MSNISFLGLKIVLIMLLIIILISKPRISAYSSKTSILLIILLHLINI